MAGDGFNCQGIKDRKSSYCNYKRSKRGSSLLKKKMLQFSVVFVHDANQISTSKFYFFLMLRKVLDQKFDVALKD